MNRRNYPGRQPGLLERTLAVSLEPELRRAVLPALQALLAAVLRQPSAKPRPGARNDKT